MRQGQTPVCLLAQTCAATAAEAVEIVSLAADGLRRIVAGVHTARRYRAGVEVTTKSFDAMQNSLQRRVLRNIRKQSIFDADLYEIEALFADAQVPEISLYSMTLRGKDLPYLARV